MYILDQLICPFLGTFFKPDELERREKRHIEMKQPASVFKISSQVYFDPYEVDGAEITTQQNPGTWINHSRQNSNCRVVPVRSKKGVLHGLVVVATKDILTGQELLHDYNDRSRTAPSWMWE